MLIMFSFAWVGGGRAFVITVGEVRYPSLPLAVAQKIMVYWAQHNTTQHMHRRILLRHTVSFFVLLVFDTRMFESRTLSFK